MLQRRPANVLVQDLGGFQFGRPERLNAFGWQEQEPVVGDQMNGADTGFVQALDRPSPEPDELLGQTGELFDALVPLLVQVVIKDNDEKGARDLCAL